MFAAPDWTGIAAPEVPAMWLPLGLFFATFASEDLACITAGLLVARGELSFVPATIACGAGIFVGDLGLYLLGRLAARGLCRWPWVQRRLPAADGALAGWRRRFTRHGAIYLFASRFLPGSRLPLYLAAGAIGWPLRRFAAVLAIAAAVWTPLLVGATALPGAALQQTFAAHTNAAWLVVPLVLVVGYLLARIVPLLFSWRGRRLLLAKWRRLSAWEYWPAWLVYPPVVAVLLYEAVRRRTPFAFTACNPGIPHGGLALESKGDILDRMASGRELPVAVAPYLRLRSTQPLEERLRAVADLLAAGNGKMVLKPDQGERGAGVAIVRDLAHAERWLRACPGDAIAQEYVDGVEFGVVWRRRADGGGEIRSIAHKVPPRLRGDGVHTLEQLVLRDRRALPMAHLHLANFALRLDEIPPAGTDIALGELGTHCRGATFVDARPLHTPALEQALGQFMAPAAGLDFGRFDLRAPSIEAFQQGRGIRILELNGVTGEPAHIYHPGYPWWRGIRDLCAHWRAACATGAGNIARGHRPSTARQLLALVAAVRRRPAFEAPPASSQVPGIASRAPA
jgi:membrane protein DedA with SNARE-associated domain